MRAITWTYWPVIYSFLNARPPPPDGSLTITPLSYRLRLPLPEYFDEARPLESGITIIRSQTCGEKLFDSVSV